MTQELLILPEDLEYAVKRRQQLEEEIKALGPEFGDVFTQSSETWHDNAPFEAVRDKQSVLAAELAQMKKIIHHSAVRVPKPKKGAVGYGSLVTLSNGKTYKIAGDWTPHAGRTVNGVTIISSRSPLGVSLFGKKAHETIDGHAKSTQIVTIGA